MVISVVLMAAALTLYVFVGFLIWLGVFALIEWMDPVWRFIGMVVGFYWGVSGAIWDFGPFKVLLTALLICASVFSPAFVWALGIRRIRFR